MTTTATFPFEQLLDRFKASPHVVCLTGAGLSLASGIPTYRDQDGNWQGQSPILHQAFLDDPTVRQRYWARSARGWPIFARARPNSAHLGLKRLHDAGLIRQVVTQNVDSLHEQAGTRQVFHLHGNLDWVDCLSCAQQHKRSDVQQQLEALIAPTSDSQVLLPDGDADIADQAIRDFQCPSCSACGGDLKPRVVFFGGSVEVDLVAQIYRFIDQADALLVVGSSLKLFSGYRFCRYALAKDKPIWLINPGWTRVDDQASLKITTPAEVAIPALCRQLGYPLEDSV